LFLDSNRRFTSRNLLKQVIQRAMHRNQRSITLNTLHKWQRTAMRLSSTSSLNQATSAFHSAANEFRSLKKKMFLEKIITQKWNTFLCVVRKKFIKWYNTIQSMKRNQHNVNKASKKWSELLLTRTRRSYTHWKTYVKLIRTNKHQRQHALQLAFRHFNYSKMKKRKKSFLSWKTYTKKMIKNKIKAIQLLIRTTHSMQQLQVLQQMNHGFKQWRNYILKFKMKEMNGVIHNSGNQIKIFFLQRLMKNVKRNLLTFGILKMKKWLRAEIEQELYTSTVQNKVINHWRHSCLYKYWQLWYKYHKSMKQMQQHKQHRKQQRKQLNQNILNILSRTLKNKLKMFFSVWWNCIQNDIATKKTMKVFLRRMMSSKSKRAKLTSFATWKMYSLWVLTTEKTKDQHMKYLLLKVYKKWINNKIVVAFQFWKKEIQKINHRIQKQNTLKKAISRWSHRHKSKTLRRWYRYTVERNEIRR